MIRGSKKLKDYELRLFTNPVNSFDIVRHFTNNNTEMYNHHYYVYDIPIIIALLQKHRNELEQNREK